MTHAYARARVVVRTHTEIERGDAHTRREEERKSFGQYASGAIQSSCLCTPG